MKRNMVIALIGALSITACGGGSTYTPTAPQPTSDVVTVGTISGFGSVISQGVEFNTDSATVMMDGDPANLADLEVGMVVTIRATVNERTGEATASAIHFTDDAEGPISNLNMMNNSFIVLGRPVFCDEHTVFDGAEISELANGNVVQISGQWRSQERIQATHIKRIANAYQAGMSMEVKGEINGLDIGLQRFRIGTQWCDYSGAALELGGADLANGLYVEVTSTAPIANGDMILDRIQARDHDRDRDQLCDSGCDFDLEGYITAFVSATDFEVDGSPVTTTDATVYVNGTIDSLVLDTKVSVQGTLDETGVLVAERIVFHVPSVIEIEADVEAIDADNAAITTLGIVVTSNESTVFRDHSTMFIREFGLDDLAIGDRIEVRAYLADSRVIATKLERDDADDGVTLKAPVDSVSQPTVTLLGVTVISDQDTVFQNAAMEIVDADTFFSLVDVDSLVKAEGAYDGTSILASKLFLRECTEGCL